MISCYINNVNSCLLLNTLHSLTISTLSFKTCGTHQVNTVVTSFFIFHVPDDR